MEEEVRKAKKGNKNSYQKLIEDISIYLYNVGISILKNDEEVADAMSSAVLKAYSKLYTLKKDKYFKTWITRILINECRDIQRKNKNITYIEDYSRQEKINSEESITKEEKIDLIQSINKLDKKIKDVIILYYYNDFKIEEIAKNLEIPVGTVKSRMNTGKNKLYELLNEGSDII